MHIHKSFNCFLLGQPFIIHITHDDPNPPPNTDVRVIPEKQTVRIRRASTIESRSKAFFEALLKLIERSIDPAITLATLVSELCHINATQPTLAQWLGLLVPAQPVPIQPAPASEIEHTRVHSVQHQPPQPNI